MRRKTAFTLVELLVVIGIIALLISILLPSLNRARQSAQRIQCMSNMRQVGLAIQMYAGNQKGWAPVPYWPYGGISRWYEFLQQTRDLTYTISETDPTVKISQVLFCPSMPRVSLSATVPDDTYRLKNGFVSYGMSLQFDLTYQNNVLTYGSVKLNTVKHPSDVVMVAETNKWGAGYVGGYYVYSFNSADPGGQLAWPWHPRGGCNVLWADGHVTTVYAPDPNSPASLYTLGALGSQSTYFPYIQDTDKHWALNRN